MVTSESGKRWKIRVKDENRVEKIKKLWKKSNEFWKNSENWKKWKHQRWENEKMIKNSGKIGKSEIKNKEKN